MTESGGAKPKSRRKRRGFGRFVGGILLVLAVLIAIPLVLTPVYLVVDPVSVPMLERYLTGKPVTRQWRPIGTISDRLKAAVILSEDGQFCRHWGVDVKALRAEIDRMLAGKEFRGASTITMQVARNLFLTNRQFFLRKALEVPLAFYIDLVLPKRRIMEIYLNIAEWGPNGQFGVEAGARTAFGTEADALSWSRASLLAVSLPNPIVRRPGKPNSGLRRIARIVEARAREYGERANCVGESGKLTLQ
ncbi:MAG: monofunctional biosynthetic peptidoglycan transglycosylase [Hyphomicrobiales bacterium]|nr:MAG: monofunctional biosynthetic peptidoglycan transglycosylase [Hyphomicrobiales bacterium]